MDRLGGFEAKPRVAVGVSGGADSLGLALLVQRWAAERAGDVLALIVDHGLRAESAAEAARVGGWLQARGIAHAILRWDGEKPPTGIQEAARAARHRLLAERCREEGILHLALAHHRDDQAETVLLRFGRGSGVDGLAAMAPVRAGGAVRVIRPLLDLPHDRLVVTCRAFGQEWIEDPSNRNPRFARARLRAAEEALAAEGLDAPRLTDLARRAARARNPLEAGTAALLAEAVEALPEAWLGRAPRPCLKGPGE
ncbi:tRNA lysidine(34) synthetase TilS, partial [Azospirillum brasilense]|nr:tRNA lysidine(34) synthetase TilS [Azospirillum brasilense]